MTPIDGSFPCCFPPRWTSRWRMSLELLGSASGGQANGVSIGDLATIGSLIWKNPGNMSTLLVGALEHFSDFSISWGFHGISSFELTIFQRG